LAKSASAKGFMKKRIIAGIVLFGVGTAQTNEPTIEVLRWNCDPPNSVGYAHSYGTIQNVSNTLLENLQVTAEYFQDKDRKVLIAQSTGLVKASKFAPKAHTTFEVLTKVAKFSACWITFETDTGILATKYPDYSNNPPPRLP
jgi:hypothetical protein